MKINYKMAAAIILSATLAFSFTGCHAERAVKSAEQIRQTDAKLVVDAQNKKGLPDKFRITSVAYIQKDREKGNGKPDLRGLSTLRISGSAQFAEAAVPAMKKAIGPYNIIVVDLRQEPHGFVNGNAVSLMGKDDKISKGQNDAQSEKSQNRFLAGFKIGAVLHPDGFSRPLTVHSVTSEAQFVNGSGMTYLRLPVTDREWPTADTVDTLLRLLKAMPKNSWLHFHCKAGQGRTTTFMAMIDMMHNAKTVSFDDILYRQNLIGGLNLTDLSTGEDVTGRLRFLRAFYRYCRTNSDDFGTIFSAYLKVHPL